MNKILVIGLDGATWRLLRPWSKDGTLRVIGRLMENGVWGSLRSTIPPATFPAWKSFSTGKNPGKLGVFSFSSFDIETKKERFHDSRDFKSEEIWDILGKNNLRCGVIDMPGTYPPKKINGMMVSGFPASERGYTDSSSLEDKLKSSGYIVYPKFKAGRNTLKDNIEYLKELFTQRFKVASEWFGSLDFLMLTIFYIDIAQHYLWNDPLELKDLWIHVDEKIGALWNNIENGTYIFVISDHGFTELNCCFYVNNWLTKHGYIKLDSARRTTTFLPLAASVSKHIHKLGLEDLLKIIPSHFKKPLATRATYNYLEDINWDYSYAIALSPGLIYINRPILNSSEYECLRKKIKKEIESVTLPATNRHVLKVFYKEEIYHGKYLSEAPDLIILPCPGYEIEALLDPAKGVWGPHPTSRLATHDESGIFIAYGPDIRKGVRIRDVRIYDVAPTILHMFGVPIPIDLDGRVLLKIFRSNSELASKSTICKGSDERRRVKTKIRELKKLAKI